MSMNDGDTDECCGYLDSDALAVGVDAGSRCRLAKLGRFAACVDVPMRDPVRQDEAAW